MKKESYLLKTFYIFERFFILELKLIFLELEVK